MNMILEAQVPFSWVVFPFILLSELQPLSWLYKPLSAYQCSLFKKITIPHSGRGRRLTRSGDQDHGETPSLLKIQKISPARWRAPVVPATLEAEAEWREPREVELAVSQDCATALQPG